MRPAGVLVDVEHLEGRSLLRVLDVINEPRHVRQRLRRLRAGLDDEADLLVLQPFRVRRRIGVVGKPADALDLAALDREPHVARRVAGDHLEFGAEQRVQHQRHFCGIARQAGGRNPHFALCCVLDRLDRTGVPDHAGVILCGDGADPFEFGRIVLRRGVAEQRLGQQRVVGRSDDAAVVRGNAVQPVGRDDAAGAGHVLGNDARMTGNMIGKMPRQQPRIGVVTASSAVGNDVFQNFAAIESLGGLRPCLGGDGDGKAGDNGQRQYRCVCRRGSAESNHVPSQKSPLDAFRFPSIKVELATGCGAVTRAVRRICR